MHAFLRLRYHALTSDTLHVHKQAEASAAAAKAAKARLQEEIETVTRAKDEADAAHRAALRAARAEASAKSLRARQLIQDKDQEIGRPPAVQPTSRPPFIDGLPVWLWLCRCVAVSLWLQLLCEPR